jgi:hypothetical protein
VDHNVFTCPGTPIHGIYVNGLTDPQLVPSGLVDHNTFTDADVLVYGNPCTSPGCWNTQTAAGTAPSGLGTRSGVYVEDNTFSYSAFTNVVDCQFLGKYIFRHNTINGSYFEAHSARTNERGCKAWEIYENTITSTGFSPQWLALLRAGTGVIFNNTWTGTFGVTGIAFDNVRSYDQSYAFDGPPHSMCYGNGDGANSPFDGNSDSDGYPCLDQIGRGTDTVGQASPYPPYPKQNTLEPAYIWNNTVNGAAVSVFINHGGSDCNRCTRVIRVNRDYYLSAKPGYTPYTYPHPLASANTAPGNYAKLRS